MKTRTACLRSLIPLVAVFVCCSLLGCGLTDSPESAVKSFLTALKTGKQIEAQDQLSRDYRSIAVGLMGGIKNENLKDYYRSDNLKSFEILSVDKSSASARATVRLTTNDGRTHQDQIDLVREDGKWRIEHF